MNYVNATTGEVLDSPQFWAMIDRNREAGTHAMGSRGAFLMADGAWWCEETMTAAELAERQAAHERDLWWQDHKRDTSVIGSLSDSDLIQFRLLADIRADIPVLNAAADELRRRGIRDYPIAV